MTTNYEAFGWIPLANGHLEILPGGKIIFVPYNSDKIGIYDPAANVFSSLSHGKGSGMWLWRAGVLAPNGKIIFVPEDSYEIGIYDPVANVFSELTHNAGGYSTYWSAGVLAPNGKIIFVPAQGTNSIGIYDPILNVFSLLPIPEYIGDARYWSAGVLTV